jgi:hypothetical protein
MALPSVERVKVYALRFPRGQGDAGHFCSINKETVGPNLIASILWLYDH